MAKEKAGGGWIPPPPRNRVKNATAKISPKRLRVSKIQSFSADPIDNDIDKKITYRNLYLFPADDAISSVLTGLIKLCNFCSMLLDQ